MQPLALASLLKMKQGSRGHGGVFWKGACSSVTVTDDSRRADIIGISWSCITLDLHAMGLFIFTSTVPAGSAYGIAYFLPPACLLEWLSLFDIPAIDSGGAGGPGLTGALGDGRPF